MAPNGEQHTEGPYESQVYAGEQTRNLEETARHDPDFQNHWNRAEVQAYIASQQSAELSDDVRMGTDRAITDTPNWMGFPSEKLYEMATQQNAPTTADTLGRAFNDGGNDLADAANRLLAAVSKLDNAWTGVAADSAKNALTPLATAAGSAGTSAQLMSAQMSQQSAAAAEVRKLPAPQEFNVNQALNAALTGGLPALQADLKAQKDAADAVKREQVSYLTAYTASLAAVDAQTPSFIAPPQTIGGGGNDNNSIGGERVGSPSIGSVYNGPGSGGPGGGTSTGGPSGGHSGIAPVGDHGQFLPGDGSGDGDDYTSIPGVTPGSGTNASGWNPATSTGPNPSLPGPTTGAGPSAGPSAGAGGFGGGFGNFGSGAGGAGAAPKGGLPAGNSGPPSAAPRGGMVPAGMGGRGGGAPMGGAPGRRGEGEEDDEHQRPSYLVEGDPDSAFGNDQMTAPSVIGDEED